MGTRDTSTPDGLLESLKEKERDISIKDHTTSLITSIPKTLDLY